MVVIIDFWECFGFKFCVIIGSLFIDLFINWNVRYVGDVFCFRVIFWIGDRLILEVWLIE